MGIIHKTQHRRPSYNASPLALNLRFCITPSCASVQFTSVSPRPLPEKRSEGEKPGGIPLRKD